MTRSAHCGRKSRHYQCCTVPPLHPPPLKPPAHTLQEGPQGRHRIGTRHAERRHETDRADCDDVRAAGGRDGAAGCHRDVEAGVSGREHEAEEAEEEGGETRTWLREIDFVYYHELFISIPGMRVGVMIDGGESDRERERVRESGEVESV